MGNIDAVLLGKRHQHTAQKQEQDIHHHKNGGERRHIAARVTQRLARQVFLHHILIQSRHGNGDKHTTDNLFHEETVVAPVGVEHQPTVGAILTRCAHRLPYFREGTAHILHNHNNGDYQSGKQKSGLQQIRPHHRLESATESVEQDDDDHHNGGKPDRNMPAIEDKHLQNKDNQIHTERRAQQSGHKEQHRTCLVRLLPYPRTQVFIYRGYIQLIVQRQQKATNHQITKHITQHHAKIGELGGIDIARHGHKGHTRQGTANHAIRHHKPRGLAVAGEIGFIVRLP